MCKYLYLLKCFVASFLKAVFPKVMTYLYDIFENLHIRICFPDE